MKKTTYLVLAMALISISLVSAQKMSLCQAFLKFGENCDDFGAWKGTEIAGDYGKFASNLEIDGAEHSYIKEFTGNLTFLADYGKFDSESTAISKVESLKKEFLTGFPVLKFADTRGSFDEAISYVVHQTDDAYRFYRACFKISRYGQNWYVTFEFPQTTKKDVFNRGGVKPFVDYVRIKEPADPYDFSKDVRRLLVEAKTAFANVKGSKLETLAMFDQYAPTFTPYGRTDCYIEDRGLGIVFYEIPITTNVTMEQLQKNASNVVRNIQATFGPEYGFMQSADGMSMSFSPVDRPYFVAGVLYVKKENDMYSMYLSIRAEPRVNK